MAAWIASRSASVSAGRRGRRHAERSPGRLSQRVCPCVYVQSRAREGR
jgi:hypothetical protein